MLGAYTGYFVTTYLGLPLIPALLISMAAGALIAMAVDQFGYKPLRKKGVDCKYSVGSIAQDRGNT